MLFGPWKRTLCTTPQDVEIMLPNRCQRKKIDKGHNEILMHFNNKQILRADEALRGFGTSQSQKECN